jgi:hypothetical protein
MLTVHSSLGWLLAPRSTIHNWRATAIRIYYGHLRRAEFQCSSRADFGDRFGGTTGRLRSRGRARVTDRLESEMTERLHREVAQQLDLERKTTSHCHKNEDNNVRNECVELPFQSVGSWLCLETC